MSHDTLEWSKEKLILEKYAFFVWCNKLEAVSGRYSQSVGKYLTTVLDEVKFIVNLYSFLLPLLHQADPSFPKVTHLPPSRAEKLSKLSLFFC